MKKLPFEASQKLWIEYMVWHIFCKYAYPALEWTPPVSYEEWCKPNMYYCGIGKMELKKRCNDINYAASELETFNEWYKRQ